MPIYNINLFQYNFFADILSSNQTPVILSDNLPFVETLFTKPQGFNFKDTLDIWEHISVGGVKRNISLNDILTVTNKAVRRYDFNLADLITFFEPTSIVDHLNIIDTLVAYVSIPIKDKLIFKEVLNANKSLRISITDSITINNNAFGIRFPAGFNSESKGEPIIDQINIAPDVVINFPRGVYADIIPPPHVTTSIIFTSDNGNYVLYRPSFGNLYKTQFNYIQLETRGRSLIQAGNDTFPYINSIKSLNFTIEYMTQQQGQGLIDFLNKNFGLPITLIDHESVSYTGLIMTPELQLTQQDKNNYSTTFDFEILPT